MFLAEKKKVQMWGIYLPLLDFFKGNIFLKSAVGGPDGICPSWLGIQGHRARCRDNVRIHQTFHATERDISNNHVAAVGFSLIN